MDRNPRTHERQFKDLTFWSLEVIFFLFLRVISGQNLWVHEVFKVLGSVSLFSWHLSGKWIKWPRYQWATSLTEVWLTRSIKRKQKKVSTFLKFNQMILKRFFSLLELSIYDRWTWFFVVIFALRRKLWNEDREKTQQQLSTQASSSIQGYMSLLWVVTLLTYPVSTCAAERSFSGMKRLKNPSSKHYDWGEAVLFGNTLYAQAQACGYWQSGFRIFPWWRETSRPFPVATFTVYKYTINVLIHQ